MKGYKCSVWHAATGYKFLAEAFFLCGQIANSYQPAGTVSWGAAGSVKGTLRLEERCYCWFPNLIPL